MIKSFALIAIAAFSLAACSKKEAPINNENELITLKFNIKNVDDVSTRALLATDENGKFLDWENGDLIGTFSEGVFPQGQTTTYTSNNNSGTVQVDASGFTLNVQTFNAGDVTKIYSYYPYSASAGKDKTSAKVAIPEAQTMSTDGFNADAMPMAGLPIEVDLATLANTDTPCGTINFCNLGSLIQFRVYTSGTTSETLTSVTYKAADIGGSFSIDLTGVDANNESTLALTASETISEITTSYTTTTNPTIGSGIDNAIDVYMVVAPGTYTGSQVIVTTNAHTYTLDASGEKTYARSHVKPMKIDISKGTQGALPATEIWNKVTSAADFTPGEYYILRGDGAFYLPNASTGNSAPACAAYTSVTPIPNAMRFIATAGENGLVFESKVAEGNFLWGANTNNGIRVSSTYSAEGASKEWSFVTLKVDETTYYTASAVSGRYLISYGTQDWRNYTSGSSSNIPAEFYKLDDGKTALEAPVLSVDGTVVSWNAIPNAEHYVVSINGGAGTNVNTTSYDLSGLSLADGEYKVSVVAAPAADSNLYNNSPAASVVVVIGDPHGTAEHPYTVAEARAAIDNGSTASDIYVVGIISEIVTEYNTQYNNTSFNISDDGSTSSNQFQAFRAVAESAEDYVVGDGIIMKGTLTKYNDTYEFAAGCIKVDQVHMPTMTSGTTFTDNQSVTITAESGVTIRYTFDGTNPSTTNGNVYTSALTLTETTTVKAVAVKGNMVTAVVSETFTKSTGNTQYLTVDFESEASTYSDWTITTITTQQTNSNVPAHGGSYYGGTDGKTAGSIQTKNKIANPNSITFFVSKESTNNTASSWIVDVSTDGTNWTQVGDSQSASAGITRGEWTEVTRNLSIYTDVYVRIRYDGTSAKRCIDDVSLSYN